MSATVRAALRHDGCGAFMPEPGPEALAPAGNRDAEGMRLMCGNLALALGQTLLFAAGRRGLPLGRFLVSVGGPADPKRLADEGLLLSVRDAGSVSAELWEELFREARASCFPPGAAVCPVRSEVIVEPPPTTTNNNLRSEP